VGGRTQPAKIGRKEEEKGSETREGIPGFVVLYKRTLGQGMKNSEGVKTGEPGVDRKRKGREKKGSGGF